MFGLITGSYGKPHDGGVLRKADRVSCTNEIDLDHRAVQPLDPAGIINTIDRLRITGFGGNRYYYSCGWIAAQLGRPPASARCGATPSPK